jgi:DNA-directed RNA polymerase subunit RPC12/RpoP
MAIFTCNACGTNRPVPDEHIGRTAKCPKCGSRASIVAAGPPPSPHVEPPPATADDAWQSVIEAADEMEHVPQAVAIKTTYVYRMLQVPPSIQVQEKSHRGTEAATFLERTVNSMADLGWEFYRVDEVGVDLMPGCLGALFGMRPNHVVYYVVTFRRPRG